MFGTMQKIKHTDDTHQVSAKWLSTSPSERLWLVKLFFESVESDFSIEVREVTNNGHVTIRIEQAIPANIRGLFLIDLESRLKNSVDIGLTIWLEPVGDKSKLRQLRGVSVKN